MDVVFREARGFYLWPLGGAGGAPPRPLSSAAPRRAGLGLLRPPPSAALLGRFSRRFPGLAAGPLPLAAPGTGRRGRAGLVNPAEGGASIGAQL